MKVGSIILKAYIKDIKKIDHSRTTNDAWENTRVYQKPSREVLF